MKEREELNKKYQEELRRKMRNPGKWEKERREKMESRAFKEPPLLGLLTRLFRGIKFDIKNIHIRYEDDFFSRTPFSFGFTLHSIKMDTDTQEE